MVDSFFPLFGGRRIIRVFPTRTTVTPSDSYAYSDVPDMFVPEVDEVRVSVSFTWDKFYGEFLAEQWSTVAPTTIGGPAYGKRSGDFVPGLYLKPGSVITSRGCPNKCWFCSVWRREGREVRELEIHPGRDILDDNILACSEGHIRAVFAMLSGRPQVQFVGGLEAARLEDWHVSALALLRIRQLYFAYDTPDDYDPLVRAGKLFAAAGFSRRKLHCYVLTGYPRDTFAAAERRLRRVWAAGFIPFSMLYRDITGYRDPAWKTFNWQWCRIPIIRLRCMNQTLSDYR